MKTPVACLSFIVVTCIFTLSSCEKKEVPVLTTTAVTNITGTTATSGGTITDEGSGTVVERGICWSKGITPTIADNLTIEGGGAGSFISNIANLDAATTYYVRAYAKNEAGTGYGMAMSFTTLGQAPTATTQPATNETVNSVTLNGMVNANYFSTIVTFEYGTSISYGQTITATQSPITGASNTNVTVEITGLMAGTEYHFRVKTVNSLGTTLGNDVSFTTLGQAPTATTQAACCLSYNGAKLNGSVNANYLSTTVIFEYGTTTAYGYSVPATPSPLTGNDNTNVSANVSGLTTGTTYHFRVKAENSLGTTFGSDLSFTPGYVFGQNLFGGLIFYIDGTGQHGLVCASTDQSVGAEWGCYGTGIPDAGYVAVGAGNQNTIAIINNCSTTGIAARICNDLILNTYSDWFLPSRDELDLMYTNLKVNGLGNFANDYYWSSTQSGDHGAYREDFSNGSIYYPYKSNLFRVRAVRSF